MKLKAVVMAFSTVELTEIKVELSRTLFYIIPSSTYYKNYMNATLLFGDNSFDSFKNRLTLDTTIDYQIKTRRFE